MMQEGYEKKNTTHQFDLKISRKHDFVFMREDKKKRNGI